MAFRFPARVRKHHTVQTGNSSMSGILLFSWEKLFKSARGATPAILRLMAHPRMYDPDDPMLARVREIALAFPGSDEKESHGRPSFYTRKVFGYYGGSIRVDDEWQEHGQAVLFLPDPAERPALVADDRFWVPAYLGPSGWLGLDLHAGTDFDEVAELLEESFRATAPKRLVTQLDSAG